MPSPPNWSETSQGLVHCSVPSTSTPTLPAQSLHTSHPLLWVICIKPVLVSGPLHSAWNALIPDWLKIISSWGRLFLHNLILNRHTYPSSPIPIHQPFLCFTNYFYLLAYCLPTHPPTNSQNVNSMPATDLVCIDPMHRTEPTYAEFKCSGSILC